MIEISYKHSIPTTLVYLGVLDPLLKLSCLHTPFSLFCLRQKWNHQQGRSGFKDEISR